MLQHRSLDIHHVSDRSTDIIVIDPFGVSHCHEYHGIVGGAGLEICPGDHGLGLGEQLDKEAFDGGGG